MREDGKLFDCFAGERKNQSLKACAQFIKNDKRYEQSVLCRAVGLQLVDLRGCNGFRDELGFSKDCASGVRVANKARLNGSELCKNDVLLCGQQLFLAVAFLHVSEAAGWGIVGFALLADVFQFDAKVTRNSTGYVRSRQSVVVQLGEFSLASAWYFDGDRRIVLLM